MTYNRGSDLGGTTAYTGKKVSVILPVYNVEKYLDRCMNSITYQTLENKDYEVILVDDGSPDSSGQKCDEYSQKFENVIVIHQKNAGAAAARNTGLKAAKGEYVFFVDPDDYIEKDYLETGYLCAVHSNADIAVFDAVREKGIQGSDRIKKELWNHAPSGFVTESYEDKLSMRCQILYPYMAATIKAGISSNGYRDGIKTSYKEKGMHKAETVTFIKDIPLSAPWDKCYRRKFLLDNDLRFPEELKVLDDMSFNFVAFGKAGTIAYAPKALYHYWIEETSITNSYKANRPELDMKTFDFLRKVIEKEDKADLYILWQAYYARIIKSFAICCRLCFFNKKNPESSSEKMKRVKNYMNSEPYKEAFSKIRLTFIEWKLAAVVVAGKLKSPGILKILDTLQNGK